jgi:hypothetical protein
LAFGKSTANDLELSMEARVSAVVADQIANQYQKNAFTCRQDIVLANACGRNFSTIACMPLAVRIVAAALRRGCSSSAQCRQRRIERAT